MVKRASKAKQHDAEGGRTGRGLTRRDIISIRETLDELAVARCPLCRMMLIARMGRRGPAFDCRCRRARSRAA